MSKIEIIFNCCPTSPIARSAFDELYTPLAIKNTHNLSQSPCISARLFFCLILCFFHFLCYVLGHFPLICLPIFLLSFICFPDFMKAIFGCLFLSFFVFVTPFVLFPSFVFLVVALLYSLFFSVSLSLSLSLSVSVSLSFCLSSISSPVPSCRSIYVTDNIFSSSNVLSVILLPRGTIAHGYNITCVYFSNPCILEDLDLSFINKVTTHHWPKPEFVAKLILVHNNKFTRLSILLRGEKLVLTILFPNCRSRT